jgi:hypothetical protein
VVGLGLQKRDFSSVVGVCLVLVDVNMKWCVGDASFE